MNSGKPGRGADQFPLRLPDGMRDRIKQRAAANNRSMNAEIVSLLEEALHFAEAYDSAGAVAGPHLSEDRLSDALEKSRRLNENSRRAFAEVVLDMRERLMAVESKLDKAFSGQRVDVNIKDDKGKS